MFRSAPHLRTAMTRLIRPERRQSRQCLQFLSDIAHPTKSSVIKALWSNSDEQSVGELLNPCENGFTTVSYNFKSDAELRAEYQNPWGYLRHGTLFEDVDALGWTIANRHCGDSNMHLVSCTVFIHRTRCGTGGRSGPVNCFLRRSHVNICT